METSAANSLLAVETSSGSDDTLTFNFRVFGSDRKLMQTD